MAAAGPEEEAIGNKDMAEFLLTKEAPCTSRGQVVRISAFGVRMYF